LHIADILRRYSILMMISLIFFFISLSRCHEQARHATMLFTIHRDHDYFADIISSLPAITQLDIEVHCL